MIQNMWYIATDTNPTLYLRGNGVMTSKESEAQPFGEAGYALQAISRLPKALRKTVGLLWNEPASRPHDED